MSVQCPVVVESHNLSLAWGQALLHSYRSSKRSLAPLVISVSDVDASLPPEDTDIRIATDELLAKRGKPSVRVSGLMIFPFDMWCRRGKPASRDFSRFCIDRLLPRLKKLDSRNRLGTYFERMMAFAGSKKKEPCTIDQLSFVVELLKNRHRRPRQSALQLSCFDPPKDHTRQPVRGFPCLQQVSVTLDGKSCFAINAYYPTQYIFDRGYGNYLGLCHLGAFLAHETRLRFTRLNCFVGRPELGTIPKSALDGLTRLVTNKLQESNQVDHEG